MKVLCYRTALTWCHSARLQAGEAVVESVEESVKAVGNRAKDYLASAKRAMGMQSDRPEMSADEIHGAAGKMQHAPPGSVTG